MSIRSTVCSSSTPATRWDLRREIKPFDLKMGAGVGFRIEIPLLGNIGFDYGYGFDRDDGRASAAGHFLIGNVNF